VDDLSIEAGDIVSVSDASYFENDPYNRFLTKRAVADDASRVLGIISTDKGLILNQAADPSKNLDYTYLRPLALSGRVPVKVSSENGPIKKGDPLTVSSVPGVATKATKPGQIIGKALETYDNSDPRAVGKVLVFVNISWYDPDVYLTSTGDLHISVDNTGKTEVKTKDGTLISRIGAFAEAVIGKLRVGVLEVKKLIVDGVDIVEKLNKLTATVEEQQKTIDALKKEVEALKK